MVRFSNGSGVKFKIGIGVLVLFSILVIGGIAVKFSPNDEASKEESLNDPFAKASQEYPTLVGEGENHLQSERKEVNDKGNEDIGFKGKTKKEEKKEEERLTERTKESFDVLENKGESTPNLSNITLIDRTVKTLSVDIKYRILEKDGGRLVYYFETEEFGDIIVSYGAWKLCSQNDISEVSLKVTYGLDSKGSSRICYVELDPSFLSKI